ncbi:tRNA 2-thiouridine(34) synthase MnmA [Verrucomicrobiota bacterium]
MAVGMSGGVDSSAVAALLVDQGYEVIGLTAHMWKEGSRCCSLEDVERARKVCHALGIKHFVVNAQDRFSERVVDPFVQEYASGRTPSPCLHCNQFIKFGFLLDRARQMDCDFLAMGHYAKVEKRDDGYHLVQPKDARKDQTYFLSRLNQAQLAHIIFPLADMDKAEAKAYLASKNVPVTSRGESQDLCFVEDGKYAEFVEGKAGDIPTRGDIIDPEGKKLGEHKGIHCYTIGQRGGLGVAAKERLYVSKLDKGRNEVTLAPRYGIMKDCCLAKEISWISGKPLETGEVVSVRPRYRHPGAEATLEMIDETTARIRFKEEQFALTPGQAAVFYRDGEVLGGGWISLDPEG